jgi:hypothetical protein
MAYQVPRKAVLSQEQLQAFQESNTHKILVSYIESLNESVVGTKLTDECQASDVCIPFNRFVETNSKHLFRVSQQFWAFWIKWNN